MKTTGLFLFGLLAFSLMAQGQIVSEGIDPEKENILKARTKQVTQFIRRFNSEESPDGKKLATTDPQYRNRELRLQYLPYLFDKQSDDIKRSTRKQFIRDVAEDGSPQWLDFHNPQWFAEVNARFTRYGETQEVILFLRLEPENLGYKWAIETVYLADYSKAFQTTDTTENAFLHPMSHEVDFMNLKKAFEQPEHVTQLATKEYTTDFRSIFFYELKQGQLQFDYIRQVKFHFLQVDNWYFELSKVEREGRNAGWLITQLMEVPESQKASLVQLIQLQP